MGRCRSFAQIAPALAGALAIMPVSAGVAQAPSGRSEARVQSAPQIFGGDQGPSSGHVTITAPQAGTPALAVNTYAASQPPASRAMVGMQFNALEDFGSFGDGNTHVGVLINGGKSASRQDTSGSWQLFGAVYTGFGGAGPESFITAGQQLMMPTPSAYNKRGNFTGNNPECVIRPGLEPTSCTGEEIDIETHVAPANIRQGLRIVDIGSSAGTFGLNTDSALGINNSHGIGWRDGITFGDPVTPESFPVAAGGSLIRATRTRQVLRSFVDFSAIEGAPSVAALALPAGARWICGGADQACAGGQIASSTQQRGGRLVFADGAIELGWGEAALTVRQDGGVAVKGALGLGDSLRLAPLRFDSLPRCDAAAMGTIAFVSDAARPITAWRQIVARGGGKARALVSCDGEHWLAFG